MKSTYILFVFALSLVPAFSLSAQQANNEKQEFAITAGEISGSNPGATAGVLSLGSGVAVQANYAVRIRDLNWGSLYWEVDGLYNPRRNLSGTPGYATRNIWSLYAVPGVRLQFSPKETISPYAVVGGGYALYGESRNTISGLPMAASNHTNRGAVEIGGGVDFALGKRYLLRADARGFYTGGPNFAADTPGGQFNFVISGGFVFRFPR